MDRRDILAERPLESGRGFMPAVSVNPSMLIQAETVVDLGGSAGGKPLLEKYHAQNHGGEFYQGVIVNGGRLLYLAGQVANNPRGSVAGVRDWRRQAEKVYANIGHVL